MSTSKGTPPTTTVVVADGWAVYHQGEQHHSGATLRDVQRDVADEWLAAGWVTATPAKTTRTPARSAK